MGRRGPKPAPTALKLAKGERRPSRVNYEEPALPAPASLEPPDGLDGAGLVEWTRLAPALRDSGVLLESDLVAFEDYCRCLTLLRQYEAKAKKAGPELAIAKGYAGMAFKLRGQLDKLRAGLGLTPASRSGVKAKPKQDDKKDNPAARYLRAIPGGRA
jgi:P27 family predicted phage terminase small subunit